MKKHKNLMLLNIKYYYIMNPKNCKSAITIKKINIAIKSLYPSIVIIQD